MPFDRNNLHRLCGGGGNSVWLYKTTDAADVVDAANYFNPAGVGVMNIGDLVIRVTLSGTALSTAGFHVVKDVSASAIDVTDTTVLTVTDTR